MMHVILNTFLCLRAWYLHSLVFYWAGGELDPGGQRDPAVAEDIQVLHLLRPDPGAKISLPRFFYFSKGGGVVWANVPPWLQWGWFTPFISSHSLANHRPPIF